MVKLVNQPVKRWWVGFPGHDILIFAVYPWTPRTPWKKCKVVLPIEICEKKVREFGGFSWFFMPVYCILIAFEYFVARSRLLQFYCSPRPVVALPRRIFWFPDRSTTWVAAQVAQAQVAQNYMQHGRGSLL